MGVADRTQTAPVDQADLEKRWRAEGRWLERTVAQELVRAAREHADVRVVFHSVLRPSVATIGEIHERALRAAAGLAALGVRPGDVVAIQVPGWLEGAVASAAGWLLAEVHGMAILRDVGPGLTHLSIFPAGHVAGVLGLLRTLVLGARSVFMDAWDAASAARLIEEHRVTSAVGPPLALATLLDEAATSGRDLSSLSEFMTGAADVSPVLIERADRAGVAAYRTYGSSEHPTITSGAPDDPLVKRATTDGRALPGSEVRIVDEGGQELPAGTEGEIVSRGAEQFLGYLDSELNDGLRLPGGWLHTGDLGRMDADGYVSVTGRKKDIIVRGGEKISATEVENILVAHPAVGEVAVVGAPDERYGERVAAFVVLRPGATLDLDAVREQFAAAGLARQKTPERLVITEELPRTASGKVQKYALREELRKVLARGQGRGRHG